MARRCCRRRSHRRVAVRCGLLCVDRRRVFRRRRFRTCFLGPGARRCWLRGRWQSVRRRHTGAFPSSRAGTRRSAGRPRRFVARQKLDALKLPHVSLVRCERVASRPVRRAGHPARASLPPLPLRATRKVAVQSKLPGWTCARVSEGDSPGDRCLGREVLLWSIEGIGVR